MFSSGPGLQDTADIDKILEILCYSKPALSGQFHLPIQQSAEPCKGWDNK